MSQDILERVDQQETWRREQFPAARDRIFMAHAAVTAVPTVAIEAMKRFNEASSTGELDYSEVLLRDMDEIRESCARLIGAKPREVALLGPTSLGLSLVARGLDWQPGDEIICHREDYPANVYPWMDLERLGVTVIQLEPERPGEITPDLVESHLSDRTRLVALASCHFLSGYRIDVTEIGRRVHARDALFCLDAIQTVGAFPTTVEEVDFLSADAHKWMLGPMTAGLFYVAEAHFDRLRPSLLGAWNVKCPQFICRDEINFEPGGRRYEPGVLNASGLHGMRASIDLLQDGVGIERVAERLLAQKDQLVAGLKSRGYRVVGPESGPTASGITTLTHDDADQVVALGRRWQENGVVFSPRQDRAGRSYLRLSPHFYNTDEEIDRVLNLSDPG